MIKALDLWLPAWLNRSRSARQSSGIRHVMLAVCDHFEPFHRAGKGEALMRVATWKRGFTELTREFSDADGTPPRHTFFYPIEQYDSDVIGLLAELCHATGSEAEVHLHHENDTAENLRFTLMEGKERLASHGLLSRDSTGALRYGFIHGNWALDHSHPQGRHCGVSNELSVLCETGCYADFTLPSAPNRTQTRTINSLYYAKGTERPKSHDSGRRVRAAREQSPAADDELLMVQGPLGLNWTRRKWGLLPRIENSDLTGANPPTFDRLQLWLDCHISVENQADWLFIKLHTHGAKPENSRMLLGERMREFHRMLRSRMESDPTIRFHYVTARELVNIVHAAEDGHTGDPHAFRDYRYQPLAR